MNSKRKAILIFFSLFSFAAFLHKYVFKDEPDSLNLSNAYILIGLTIFLTAVFLLVQYTRKKRIANWKNKLPDRVSYSIKFSFLLSIPTIAITYFLVKDRTEIIYFVLFLALPILLVMAFVGYTDYQHCKKIYMDDKYMGAK